MVRYLLDTNILSDLLRNPGGRVARRLAVVGEPAVCTSVVVAGDDLLIAAHALALDLILVTENVDEFARVPRLPIENWLAS